MTENTPREWTEREEDPVDILEREWVSSPENQRFKVEMAASTFVAREPTEDERELMGLECFFDGRISFCTFAELPVEEQRWVLARALELMAKLEGPEHRSIGAIRDLALVPVMPPSTDWAEVLAIWARVAPGHNAMIAAVADMLRAQDPELGVVEVDERVRELGDEQLELPY